MNEAECFHIDLLSKTSGHHTEPYEWFRTTKFPQRAKQWHLINHKWPRQASLSQSTEGNRHRISEKVYGQLVYVSCTVYWCYLLPEKLCCGVFFFFFNVSGAEIHPQASLHTVFIIPLGFFSFIGHIRAVENGDICWMPSAVSGPGFNCWESRPIKMVPFHTQAKQVYKSWTKRIKEEYSNSSLVSEPDSPPKWVSTTVHSVCIVCSSVFVNSTFVLVCLFKLMKAIIAIWVKPSCFLRWVCLPLCQPHWSLKW